MLTPNENALRSPAGPASGAAGPDLLQAGDELERRIRAGESAIAEEYFRQNPALADDPEQALDLIFLEYVTRRTVGQTPAWEEYFERFPLLRSLLDHQFQIDELLNEPVHPDADLASDLVGSSLPAHGGSSDGRFRIVRLLARGGIGQVMRAVDTELNREVAVKELQPALAESDEVRERFMREAEITGKLEHPGIVPVYGLGRDGSGRPFYAMRLVRGQSFQEAVQEFYQHSTGLRPFGGVEFQKLLRRFLHVCETVEFAHSRGVIHRDLKPANILLGPFGETLVVDWGLARTTNAEGFRRTPEERLERPNYSDSPATRAACWSDQLTQATGQLIGTPAFMSPEQASGTARELGPTADVYSLGATLYVLLTGRAPFSGTDVPKTLELVALGRFARPREIHRAIPQSLEAVCLKAMARQSEDRYPSARDLANDLEHWLADEPVKAMREPLAGKLARWGRRHRSHVVAGMLALVAVSVISVAAALRINNERLRADRERIESNRRSSRLAFDRGTALATEHEHGSAMLWFARALEHTSLSDTAMRRVILTNLDAAQRHLVRRERVFKHAGWLTAAAFSPDGRRLVTTGGSNLAILWDAETGSLLSEHSLMSGRVVAAGYSAGGDALNANYQRGSLQVYRLSSNASQAASPPITIRHDGDVANAVFNSSGQFLATATPSGPSAKIRIWRVSNGELFAEIEHPGAVEQIVFQPQTSDVAIVTSDGGVRLWQLPNKRLLSELRSTGSRIVCVAFTPDGKSLLAGDTAGIVSRWNVEDARRQFDIAHQSGRVTAVICSSDGQTMAAAWDTGAIRTWNLETRRPASELLRLDRFTSNLAFRPGLRQLLIAAELDEFVLWQLPDLVKEAPPINQQRVISVAISGDGKNAVTGSYGGSARLRNGATGRAYGKVLRHAGSVTSVAFRPSDNAVVLTASRDGTSRLWNVATGEPHGSPMQHRTESRAIGVETAAFSPDGRIIVTGDRAGVVRTWNGDTGELLREVDHRQGNIISIRFSPSGKQLVAGLGAPENGVLLWDVEGGEARWKSQHGEPVRSVVFSPDGRIVLSASNDDTARFWDAESGQQLGPELRHRGEVWVAEFSPDGRTAVTGGYDATIKLWSVPDGKPVGEPMRHEGIVMSAAFSRDGQRLLTGSGDRSARLWDVATCLPLASPLPHTDLVRALSLSPTENMGLTGRVWHLPSPLPDDPPLLDLWVKLATARAFSSGDNIEWLEPATLSAAASEFQARTGTSWDRWDD